jgi:hypothetical protein
MSYLKFEDRGTSDSGKTKRWAVLNSMNGVALGWKLAARQAWLPL